MRFVGVPDLTNDQMRAIAMDRVAHKVISGWPGSGRTLILLHRARHLLNESGCDAERLHIFVPTAAAKSYVQRGLYELDIPRSSVSTVESWCVDYHRAHIGDRLPADKGSAQPDCGRLRSAVLNALRELTSDRKPLDFALIDEAQDISRGDMDVIAAASRHVTAAINPNQVSFSARPDRDRVDVVAGLGVRKISVSLLDTLRCTPYVTRLASAFITDSLEASQWEAQARLGDAERETPLLYISSSEDDEKERLIQVLQTRLENNERVAVLVPRNDHVARLVAGLHDAGFEVESDDEIDFRNDMPKVMSYRNASGLSFDSVLMPELGPAAFAGASAAYVQRLLFGAVTRSSKWAYMSTSDSSFFRPLRPLLELADEGVLSIDGLVISRPGHDLSRMSADRINTSLFGDSCSRFGLGDEALVTVKVDDFRTAVRFLSRGRPARIRAGFDGHDLILEVGASTARVPATGRWPGTAKLFPHGLLQKLEYVMRDVAEIEISVAEGRLRIGPFTVDCEWERGENMDRVARRSRNASR